MNDRNDFLPAVRNSAWWSGDSRMAANGKGNEAVMQKLGLMERPDLSQVEAVQMGHVMEPVILRLAQDKLKMEIKEAPYSLTHPKHTWMKSHFDGISSDGKTLVECKNYNAAVRNKFDSDNLIVPPADLAQIIHEAAVHNVERVVLAVLFGGQEFQTFDFVISETHKDELIKDMAVFWAAVERKQPLEAENPAQAKILYADTGGEVVADARIEKAVMALKQIKAQIKALEAEEEKFLTALQIYMKGANSLMSVDGSILATWKQTKATKRFDKDLFQRAMPDIYEQFVTDSPGSRRFLTK